MDTTQNVVLMERRSLKLPVLCILSWKGGQTFPSPLTTDQPLFKMHWWKLSMIRIDNTLWYLNGNEFSVVLQRRRILFICKHVRFIQLYHIKYSVCEMEFSIVADIQWVYFNYNIKELRYLLEIFWWCLRKHKTYIFWL